MTVFLSVKHTGARTSLIVDPPNGRIPPLTPEAQKTRCRRSGISSRPVAIDRDVQEQVVRPAAAANTIRRPRRDAQTLLPATTPLAHQSPRWSGGRRVGGPLPDRRAARVWHRVRRQLPADRADTRRHLDVLRRGSGPRLAAQHRHERQPASAGQHPPVVWRFARPLGGQYARHRRDELQSEDRFSGLAREPAPGRALDADRPDHARIRGHDRRSDGVDAAMDRQAGVHQAERSGEQNLLRAALHRRKLCAFRGCCTERAWKSSPLRRDEVPIRQPGTPWVVVLCFYKTRWIRLQRSSSSEVSTPPSSAATSRRFKMATRCV